MVAPLGRVSGAATSDGPLPPLDIQPDKGDRRVSRREISQAGRDALALARLATLETRHTFVSRFMSRGRPTVTDTSAKFTALWEG